MAEKRKLTVEFIKNLIPPEKGERWISDTELQGFGVRLWGGRTKGKSLAIRVNLNGKIFRKSIDSADVDNIFWDEYNHLEQARKRAKYEINKLKEKLKELQDTSPKALLKRKIRAMSFDELADFAIKEQHKKHRSEQYVYDNHKRYNIFASPALGKKLIRDVTAKEINYVLDSVVDKAPFRSLDISRSALPVIMAYLNICPQDCNILCAVSTAPRFSIFLRVCNSSGAVISFIGLEPR